MMDLRERTATARIARPEAPVAADNGSIELPISDFFPDRLGFIASRVVRAAEKECLGKHELGLAEWRILSLLNEVDMTTSKTIGGVTGMHKTKVSRAVADLERRALIARKPNRNDLRESLLSLTERGRALVGKIAPEARAFSRRLWNTLDDSERSAVESMIGKLSESVAA